MKLENLTNVEYADALKEAIIKRRGGEADAVIDTLLGNLAYSITRWGLAELVQRRKLFPPLSNDPDFQSQCMLMVVTYFDKIKLEMDPKAMLVYFKRVAQSAARDQLLAMNCNKRKHEDVMLDDVTLTTDFYGRLSATYETALDY